MLLAESLKAEYVTRNAGNAADMFAFWPTEESPIHLMFCIEGGWQDLGRFLPGGLIKIFYLAVRRIKLSDGSVETILRGTSLCDGTRRTPALHLQSHLIESIHGNTSSRPGIRTALWQPVSAFQV